MMVLFARADRSFKCKANAFQPDVMKRCTFVACHVFRDRLIIERLSRKLKLIKALVHCCTRPSVVMMQLINTKS